MVCLDRRPGARDPNYEQSIAGSKPATLPGNGGCPDGRQLLSRSDFAVCHLALGALRPPARLSRRWSSQWLVGFAAAGLYKREFVSESLCSANFFALLFRSRSRF